MDWLKRTVCTMVRKRETLGFGVHSPFVYGLLTEVFREQMPYYAYSELASLPADSSLPGNSMRVNRLLFRLVNRFKPSRIVEVGTGNGLSALYMARACKDAEVVTFTDGRAIPGVILTAGVGLHCVPYALSSQLWRELNGQRTVDLLHISHTPRYREAYELACPHTAPHTLFIIDGIHQEADKERWWRTVETDVRNSITIDLYDVGLVFFDPKRTKRNYKMTF